MHGPTTKNRNGPIRNCDACPGLLCRTNDPTDDENYDVDDDDVGDYPRSTCARVRKCWKISSSAKPPQPRGGAPAPATAVRCSKRSPTNLPLQSSRNREALLLLPQPRGGAGRCYLARAIFLDLRSRGPFLHIPLGIRSRDRGALLDLPFLSSPCHKPSFGSSFGSVSSQGRVPLVVVRPEPLQQT